MNSADDGERLFLSRLRRLPMLTSRRCWLAEPDADPLPVRCSGCRERFETLVEFEQHVRAVELAMAAAL